MRSISVPGIEFSGTNEEVAGGIALSGEVVGARCGSKRARPLKADPTGFTFARVATAGHKQSP